MLLCIPNERNSVTTLSKSVIISELNVQIIAVNHFEGRHSGVAPWHKVTAKLFLQTV